MFDLGGADVGVVYISNDAICRYSIHSFGTNGDVVVIGWGLQLHEETGNNSGGADL
jgi:hypothetical protein